MTNVKPTMEINRTCGTVISGVLFISMLASGNGIATVDTNCLHNTDVGIIQSDSAEICKTYTALSGICYSLSGYNMCDTIYSGVEKVLINGEKKDNLQKIDQIATLEDGWNGNKAKAFESELISKVRKIITALEVQPELFPTACDSIQIEYEKEDGAYLEIDLNLKETWEVFEINSEGEESYYSISANVETINKVVNSFYG